ncbi:hypothetical protein [Roseisolibacter agri]|uniref:Uncharacterized protein n=1 Tax=Roseisolibacter agri TaxID=2014610 RepID=A0AA37QF82_9BACT|nr:hypothetical protein [Roseisolibacter agri]GLC25698.1 hypothetical protein rosag_22110 [Roseisolibacter agri]
MYATCLRCERALGTNDEVPHLRVGRRLAFDTVAGRLWVVCRRCAQWNLTPIESRWEALAECEALALAAETRGGGATLALARTRSGLELLRVGGMPDADIANWRYGRRLQARQWLLRWTALALAVLALLLGVRAAMDTHAPQVGVYVTLLVGFAFAWFWARPPRLWATIPHAGGRHLLWGYQLAEIHFAVDDATGQPTLVVPRMVGGELRLRGRDAAGLLVRLLPRINGADCASASLTDALARVGYAEDAAVRDLEAAARRAGNPEPPVARGTRRQRKASARVARQRTPLRPWEHVVVDGHMRRLLAETPERRLALEMAVTEELEQIALEAHADALTERWRDEEEVGAIADDLLVPDAVRDRLRAAQEARDAQQS